MGEGRETTNCPAEIAEICLLLPWLRISVALISSPSLVRRPQRQRRLVYHSLLGQWCRWTSWRRPGRRPGTSGYPVFGQSSEDYLWCLLYDKSSSIVSFVAATALPTTKFLASFDILKGSVVCRRRKGLSSAWWWVKSNITTHFYLIFTYFKLLS